MTQNRLDSSVNNFFAILGALILGSIVFLNVFSLNNPKDLITGFGVLQGDVNNDGRVDILDFQLLSNSFGKAQGQTGFNPNADINVDARVDILDFQILSNNFGRTEVTSTPTQPPTPSPRGNLETITFSPITDDIKNPERGFYRQANIFVDQPFDQSKISARMPTDSLVWVYFHLENYRDPRDGPGVNLTNYQGRPLEAVGSGRGLDTVQRTFEDARRKGLKLIIRFLYIGYSGIGSNTNPATSEPDAPLTLVQQHLNQLSPLLSQNKDVIAAFQFGFVGYWGEWHSSKYLHSLDARRGVMQAVLAATPRDRIIQVRYPRYKQLFFGGPLSESQAYTESDLARIGYHDDAFLRDNTDGGTFSSNTAGVKVTNYCDSFQGSDEACWRDYINKDSRFVGVSGEAGTHNTSPSELALCPNAIPALEKLHFNSIHNAYSLVTLNAWANGGCMPEIRRRLGYRLELKQAILPRAVSRGGTLPLNISLRNIGFGTIFNPRPVYVVLQGPGGRIDIPLNNIDPRRWFAGGDYIINTNISIPQSVAPGTYKLSLWLPDTSQNLRSNNSYSIRFANFNTWNSTEGLNLLTNNLLIQ